ncbi:hypothetical protein [Ferdinandcohnia sp. Marseille-Q9671]
MENDLKHGIIVDFFGLPGSGKTTIAHLLANKLNENGYEIQENIYYMNNEYSSLKRIVIKTVNTITFTIKNFAYLCDLFSMFSGVTIRNYHEVIKQWVNVCFVLTNVNQTNKKDFVIADQGIIQAAISLSVTYKNVDIEAVIRKLYERVNSPVRHIYISVELEKDLERLNLRDNGKLRVDFEKDEVLQRFQLKVIEKLCNEVIKSFPHTIIDNNGSFQSELTSIINTGMLEEVMRILETSSRINNISKGCPS